MSEDFIVGSVFFGGLFLMIVGVIIRALMEDKYTKGIHDEQENQREYYSWVKRKTIDDLLIRKVTPMVKITSASGVNHTLTRKNYNKRDDAVELPGGALLKKDFVESYEYFFLGEGAITGKGCEEKQLMMFYVKGKEFNNVDDIEWMTTYGLYAVDDAFWTHDKKVLSCRKLEEKGFWGEGDVWSERNASIYNPYFLMMKDIDDEEIKMSGVE